MILRHREGRKGRHVEGLICNVQKGHGRLSNEPNEM